MIEATEEIQEAILSDLHSGLAARALAKKYLVTYYYVWKLAHEHGVPLMGRSMKALRPEAIARRTMVYEAVKEIGNMAEVARRMGMSRERVRQLYEKHIILRGLHGESTEDKVRGTDESGQANTNSTKTHSRRAKAIGNGRLGR